MHIYKITRMSITSPGQIFQQLIRNKFEILKACGYYNKLCVNSCVVIKISDEAIVYFIKFSHICRQNINLFLVDKPLCIRKIKISRKRFHISISKLLLIQIFI